MSASESVSVARVPVFLIIPQGLLSRHCAPACPPSGLRSSSARVPEDLQHSNTETTFPDISVATRCPFVSVVSTFPVPVSPGTRHFTQRFQGP